MIEAKEEKVVDVLEVNPVRYIIISMRHVSPPVLYEDAPLSYLSSGAANSFYQGEGENLNASVDDPGVLVYYVIRPIIFVEQELNVAVANEHPIIKQGENFGIKLIGHIPCSDSFGVSLVIDRYTKGKEYLEQQKKK